MNVQKNARLPPQGRLLLVRRVDELGWQMAEAPGGRRPSLPGCLFGRQPRIPMHGEKARPVTFPHLLPPVHRETRSGVKSTSWIVQSPYRSS